MQNLVSEMSERSDLIALAHSVCELCGPFAATHGVEELIKEIECSIDTARSCGDHESALMQLAVRVLGEAGAAHLAMTLSGHPRGGHAQIVCL